MLTPSTLILHNRYQQAGGEDAVAWAEAALLRNHGHRVRVETVDNAAIPAGGGGLFGKVGLAAQAIWNRRKATRIGRLVADEKWDIVHVHNTLPLLSPTVFRAARRTGAATVHTLHNYRLVCPGATLFRNGAVCEQCVGHFPWAGLKHRCYQGNLGATATVAAVTATHQLLGTYQNHIDRYIALTDFSRSVLLKAGLPAQKVVVKPNFLPEAPQVASAPGGYAFFAGRLSPEKGIRTLVAAWRDHNPRIPLHIAGDGPEAEVVREAAATCSEIRWLGRLPKAETAKAMASAAMVVIPSLWYEGFPLVVVEAFAMGKPIVASNLGSLGSIITHGETGWLFPTGDPAELASAVREAYANPARLAEVGLNARTEFNAHYSAENNYQQLVAIYGAALETRRRWRC